MPKYKYQLTNGKSLTLEGDTQPSDDEVSEIAKQNGVELQHNTAPPVDNRVQKDPVQDAKQFLSDTSEKPSQNTNVKSENSTPKEGFFSKAGHVLFDPLSHIPSDFADKASEYINPNRETKGLKGIGSALVESLGHIGDDFTSPASLLALGASGGLSAATRFGGEALVPALRAASRASNLPFVAQGVHGAIEGHGLSEKALGVLEAALGAHGFSSSGKLSSIVESARDTSPEVISEAIDPKMRSAVSSDPNFARGYGDPELAGSIPYPHTQPDLPLHELPPDLVPPGREAEFNAPRALEELPTKTSEDRLLELAKQKQGMGLELPAEGTSEDRLSKLAKQAKQEYEGGTNTPAEEIKPKAIFKGMQEDGNGGEFPLFDVEGGMEQQKGVSAEKLQELGIKVPEVPESAASESTSVAPQDESLQKMRTALDNTTKTPANADDVFSKPFNPKSLQFGRNRGIADSIFPTEKAAPEVLTERTASGKPKYRFNDKDGSFTPLDPKTGEPVGPPIYPKNDIPIEKVPEGKQAGLGFETPEEKLTRLRDVSANGVNGGSNGNGRIPPEQGKLGMDGLGGNPDKPSLLQSIYDLPRGLMSVDLPYMTSAAFRQASPYVGTADWLKAWAPAAESFGSEEAYNAINDELFNRPLIRSGYAEKAGLSLTDLGRYSKREEVLRGELAEKIPGYGKYVRASNRAYTAFLNSLRVNRFENLIDAAKADGLNPHTNLHVGSQIADAINTLTGRGKLATGIGNHEVNVERASKVLSNIFFSPRKMASEIQMLNPNTYIMTNPVARKELISGMVRRVGIWATISGMAKWAGADVSTDITNPDFGKIKIGNTRIDPPGGLQQYITFLGQAVEQGKTSSTSGKFSQFGEGFKPETLASNGGRFLANRLHPTAKTIWDAANATQSSPFHSLDRAAQLAAPMYIADVAQAVRDNPSTSALILGLSGVGIGSQTYNKGSFGQPTFIPEGMDLNFPSKQKKTASVR